MSEKTCGESRAIQSNRVFPGELNQHGTLFGGRIMALMDEVASIAVSRHCRLNCVTGSIDVLDFLQPILSGDAFLIEAYVTGVGNRSIEVFCKGLGENLRTGKRYLAATSFMTFVVIEGDKELQLPGIVPETAEEKLVCAGFELRRQQHLLKRSFQQELRHVLASDI